MVGYKRIKTGFCFLKTPYDGQRYKKYSATALNNFTTTCYIPYGLMMAGIWKLQFDLKFHRVVKIIFCETAFHKNLYKKYCNIKQELIEKKVFVTSYPKLDYFLDLKKSNPDKKN